MLKAIYQYARSIGQRMDDLNISCYLIYPGKRADVDEIAEHDGMPKNASIRDIEQKTLTREQ